MKTIPLLHMRKSYLKTDLHPFLPRVPPISGRVAHLRGSYERLSSVYHVVPLILIGRCIKRWSPDVGSGSLPARILICREGCNNFGAARLASLSFRKVKKSSSSTSLARCLFFSLWSLTVIQGTASHRSGQAG